MKNPIRFITLLSLTLECLITPVRAEVPAECRRIVSLAPSITEVLFALDLGVQVVGVTRYCLYPETARSVAKIGGFLDPSLETIVNLEPTLVIVPKEQRETAQSLSKLKISTIALDHTNVNGILASIGEIGFRCSRATQADRLRKGIERRVDRVKSLVTNLPPVRTMVVVGRGDKGTKSIYVSGRDGFYSDLVRIAGGTNVNTAATIAFPIMSSEAILSVNPEVVFEIAFNDQNPTLEREIKEEWSFYGEVSAVRNGRIHIFTDHYMSIPGPRFPDVLERMAKLIHPEAAW